MGLGDDLIGYEIPGPGWFADSCRLRRPQLPGGSPRRSRTRPPITTSTTSTTSSSRESVGPDGGELVPQHLAALADALPDPPGNFIENGRFLLSDGSYTRKGKDSPVGMWVLPSGTTSFTPGPGKVGTLVALPGIASFGTTAVDLTGQFMDYDGVAQRTGPTSTPEG